MVPGVKLVGMSGPQLRRICVVEIQLNGFDNFSIAGSIIGIVKLNVVGAQGRGSAAVPSHGVGKPLGGSILFPEKHSYIFLEEIGPYCRTEPFLDHHCV